MKTKRRICHLTSVHDSMDDRIFLKECLSLTDAGYDVHIVAKGKDLEKDGVKIHGCGIPSGRIDRILFFSKIIYKKALSLDCEIYHFHDPELLLYGLKLKKKGKIVIFDSHEDVPSQILDKYWIPLPFRKTISYIYKCYETYVVKRIDAVVAATEHIAECFKGRSKAIVVINNYPKLDDIKFHDTPFEKRDKTVCYVGGISEIRGEKIMLEAIKGLDVDLMIAGDHELDSIPNGKAREIRYVGMLDREGINDLFGKSRIGLCLLTPTVNYINSMPIKLFEYMAAGLPVIASDFPLWKTIIEGNKCGITVNCRAVKGIRDAIRYLMDRPSEAKQMGINGKSLVDEKYNWGIEEKKLVDLYKKLKNDKKRIFSYTNTE